jgi:hypothetical protein
VLVVIGIALIALYSTLTMPEPAINYAAVLADLEAKPSSITVSSVLSHWSLSFH